MPIYEQVAGIIRARIEAGELAPYDPVPSETALVQEHGVARSTARRAIRELRETGWVFTLPARGSYVSPHDSDTE